MDNPHESAKNLAPLCFFYVESLLMIADYLKCGLTNENVLKLSLEALNDYIVKSSGKESNNVTLEEISKKLDNVIKFRPKEKT